MAEAVGAVAQQNAWDGAFSTQERKGQMEKDVIITSIQGAVKYDRDEDGSFKLDSKGNRVVLEVSDTRFMMHVKDPQSGTVKVLWPLKNMFLNGVVPMIPGIDGLPARVTLYQDDENRTQVLSVAYNVSDTLVVPSATLKAIENGTAKFSLN